MASAGLAMAADAQRIPCRQAALRRIGRCSQGPNGRQRSSNVARAAARRRQAQAGNRRNLLRACAGARLARLSASPAPGYTGYTRAPGMPGWAHPRPRPAGCPRGPETGTQVLPDPGERRTRLPQTPGPAFPQTRCTSGLPNRARRTRPPGRPAQEGQHIPGYARVCAGTPGQAWAQQRRISKIDDSGKSSRNNQNETKAWLTSGRLQTYVFS